MSGFDDDRQRPLRWLGIGLQLGAGAVAIAILGSGWLIASSLSGHREQQEQLRDQARALATRDTLIREQHETLAARVRNTQHDIAAAEERLGTSPHESRFIAQLAELSEAAGLEVSSVRPGSTVHHGSVAVLELQMSCDGTHASLCSFLDQLNDLPRLCHVSGMKISLADSETGTLRIEFQLQLLFAPLEPKSTT
jgi:Tfp pilus assembly protein PilO